MTWRTAYSLDELLAEINAAAPGRSKLSDGSIGDAAHASRSSDHNPWVQLGGVGIVRARDFTHDPGRFDAHALAERIRLLGQRGGHPALGPGAYVISNRRIASDTYGWGWRPYGGSNPHDKHSHVSVALAAAGFDSRRPWGVAAPHQEDDMFEASDRAKLTEVHADVNDLLERHARQTKILREQARRNVDRLLTKVKAGRGEVRELQAEVEELRDQLEALQ